MIDEKKSEKLNVLKRVTYNKEKQISNKVCVFKYFILHGNKRFISYFIYKDYFNKVALKKAGGLFIFIIIIRIRLMSLITSNSSC
jgi:hypothetical protein